MHTRQRFLGVMLNGSHDRIPLVEWPIRESTLQAWHRQGLTEPVLQYAGLEPYEKRVPVRFGHMPSFPIKVLEQDGIRKVWIDAEGATRVDLIDQATPGFVTRQWLRFPVENRADFLAMTKRYDAGAAERYPHLWPGITAELNAAAATISLTIPFLFWTVRQWMGMENACLTFCDDPKLMREMLAYITDFVVDVLARLPDDLLIDRVILNEDMAYKGHAMISPAMFRSFLQPHYRRINSYLRDQKKVKVILVDCDGNPGELIPLWLEAGMDGFSPVEIAAGVDPLALRRRYGASLAMMGAIDKRALARGKGEVYAEVMSKVPQLLAQGRYIPHVDHAVPPDVPLANFVYYRHLLRQLAEGKPVV